MAAKPCDLLLQLRRAAPRDTAKLANAVKILLAADPAARGILRAICSTSDIRNVPGQVAAVMQHTQNLNNIRYHPVEYEMTRFADLRTSLMDLARR